MRRHCPTLLAMLAVTCMASASLADPIAVANHSFEDPDLSGGGQTWSNTIPDWNKSSGDSFIDLLAFSGEGLNSMGLTTGSEVSQDLGVALLPNTTYNLTVAIGNRVGHVDATGNATTIALYAGGDATGGGTLLEQSIIDAATLPADTFVDQTLSYTTGAAVPGGNLVISLSSGGGNRGHFDNVRLSAVPEPGTMALCAAALLAGLGYRRR